MKTIIAGSRDVTDYALVEQAMQSIDWVVHEVVSGMAKGVDKFGLRWAYERDISVAKFPADWNTHGKAAGPIRNREMAKYGEALVAIWDGKSRGTKNMVKQAKEHGLKVAVFLIEELERDLQKEEEDTQDDRLIVPAFEDSFGKQIPQHSVGAHLIQQIDTLEKRVVSLEEDVQHLKSIVLQRNLGG